MVHDTPSTFVVVAPVLPRTQKMMLRVRGRGGGGTEDPPTWDTIASCEPYPDLVDEASDCRDRVDVGYALSPIASTPDAAVVTG